MSDINIIAEIGSTFYDPDKEIAFENCKQAINESSLAGATAVKFQLFRADTLYSRKRAPDLYNAVKPYELPSTWIPALRAYADECDVQFVLSFFDAGLILKYAEYVHALKVASGDITFYPLLETVADFSRDLKIPVLLSTGASLFGDVVNACSVLRRRNAYKVVLFHCLMEYPANLFNMQLFTMRDLVKLGDEVGISDHTLSSTCSSLAMALGATWFEKHFMLESTDEQNPDFTVSLDYVDFKDYTYDLHDTNLILGDQKERHVTKKEFRNVENARRNPSDWLRPSWDEDEEE